MKSILILLMCCGVCSGQNFKIDSSSINFIGNNFHWKFSYVQDVDANIMMLDSSGTHLKVTMNGRQFEVTGKFETVKFCSEYYYFDSTKKEFIRLMSQ